jgi:uncharacterized protein
MADVEIRPSPGRGRGVFAARRFAPGETIEVCPVIALSEDDARALDATGLYDYYFGWGDEGKAAAIALGYGSIYNHSPESNAVHRKCVASGTMTIVATGNIELGDEIFISYQPNAWFEVK